MQQKLYFACDDDADRRSRGDLYARPRRARVPGRRVIAVDLDHNVTRVLNSDYFGESKKGACGCGTASCTSAAACAPRGPGCIPTSAGDKVFMHRPVRHGEDDDDVHHAERLEADPGRLRRFDGGRQGLGTENGCFAKTFSLDPAFEPSIHGAVTKPTTYMENASTRRFRELLRAGHTQNGRAVFEMRDLLTFEDGNVGPVDYLPILNRNENLIPPSQARQEQSPRTSCSARPRARRGRRR